MNKSFIYLFLIIFFNFGFCQDFKNKKAIDSLHLLISKTKNDSTKIEYYHQICKKYYPDSPLKIKFYNDKIYTISKKNKYNRGIGLHYLNLADIDYINRDLPKGIKDSQEAYKILSKTTDVKNHLNAALYLGFAYLDNLEHEKAKKIIKENLSLAHQFNDPKILAKLYLFLGETFDYDIASIEAIECFKK